MKLTSTLESLLFISVRPMSIRKLAELAHASAEEVMSTLDELSQRFNTDDSGIHLIRQSQTVQMVSSPLNSKIITAFLKEEQAGELSRPALEALTIIAYRGPISKIQLDTIRGVNCALILRNLMIKGLVEAKNHKDKYQTSYQVTSDFIRYLGLHAIRDLPDYEQLHTHEHLEQLLNPTQVNPTEEFANTNTNDQTNSPPKQT